MKFTILQSNFKRAINSVSRVVGNKTTLPVLSHLLIEAQSGKIKISATDLEVAITTQIAGKVEEEGRITTPARLLSDFVLNDDDESMKVTQKELTLNLKSDLFEANIKGIDAEEFPTIPEKSAHNFCSLPCKEFTEALKKVTIAAATDDARPVLAGVLFKFDGKSLTLVATDSYRLAEYKMDTKKETPKKEIIVPSRTMNEVLRLASAVTDEISVDLIVEENQIFFIIGENQIVSRLIEGSFPNYEQIIPSSSKIKIQSDLQKTLSAIKMSSLFAKDIANNIKFKTGKNEITIKSVAGEVGDTTSSVEAQVTGDPVEIAFNAKYLMEALSVLPGPEVIFSFNDALSPGLITSKKETNYTYLVMPLKLDN